MKLHILEIINLLKTGKVENQHSGSITNALIGTATIFSLSYLLDILLIISLITFFRFFNIDIPRNQTINLLSRETTTYLLLTTIVTGPIFEEIIYRIGLKFTPLNLTLMTIIIFYSSSSIFFLLPYSFQNIIIRASISLTIGLFLFIILTQYNNAKKSLKKFWLKNKVYILYISVISFGVSHIFNFTLTFSIVKYIPFITLPQTLAGIILCYVRLKYNILYSLLLHSSKNAISILITIYFWRN